MIHETRYSPHTPSQLFLYYCPYCKHVSKDPFPEIMPYNHIILQCPFCGSLVEDEKYKNQSLKKTTRKEE